MITRFQHLYRLIRETLGSPRDDLADIDAIEHHQQGLRIHWLGKGDLNARLLADDELIFSRREHLQERCLFCGRTLCLGR